MLLKDSLMNYDVFCRLRADHLTLFTEIMRVH